MLYCAFVMVGLPYHYSQPSAAPVICMPLSLMSIASNFTCLINVSTNHSPFVEAATVSEHQ